MIWYREIYNRPTGQIYGVQILQSCVRWDCKEFHLIVEKHISNRFFNVRNPNEVIYFL